MGAQDGGEPWRAELARIAAQLDDLRARSDEEYRMLHADLNAQIAEIRVALHQMQADVTSLRPDAYAQRVAAQIAELKAKGDAAYERLQTITPDTTDQISQHPSL